MTRKESLTAVAVFALLTSGAIAVWQVRLLHGAEQYNDALRRGALLEAADHDSDRGRLARALAYQTGDKPQDALKLYSDLRNADDRRIRLLAQFNTANIYVRWATDADETEQPGLTMPLLELAKQGYREILYTEPDFWPARYNLERTLQLLPDGEVSDPAAQGMPEHSPRALGSMDAHRELP